MARKRQGSRPKPLPNGKGRQWPFIKFPTDMLNHPAFLGLSGRACKLLLYLAGQYRGNNNGDLQATLKLARAGGWESNANLTKAVRELQDAGFIVLARQGGRNRCSLYALTWFGVDSCDGKLDIPASPVPGRDWKKICAPPAVQFEPPVVQSEAGRPQSAQQLNHGRCSQPEKAPRIEPPVVTSIDLPRGSVRRRDLASSVIETSP